MSFVIQTPGYFYGFHLRKYNTFVETFKNVPNHLSAFQIYIGNGRSFAPPKIDEDDIIKARYSKKNRYFCIHGSLILNPCGSTDPNDPDLNYKTERMRKLLTSELDVGAGLGGGVVLHIGSCKDTKLGIKRIADTLNDVLTRKTSEGKRLTQKLKISEKEFIQQRIVILENCAGEGNKIGKNLEEIKSILDLVKPELLPQVKICIDTAHDHGAGNYHWGDPKSIRRFYQDFERIIGLDKLEVFHLNDSKVEFGSCKDRHQILGQGYIFEGQLEGLKEFFFLANKHQIPIIGEPPKDAPYPIQLREYNFVENLLSNTKLPLLV